MARKLDNAYRRYNRLYFNNQLPIIPVRFSSLIWKKHSRRQRYGQFEWLRHDDGTYEPVNIAIADWTNTYGQLWRSTLLHEMVHVYLRVILGKSGATHGKFFEQEMKRLASMGAFKGLW